MLGGADNPNGELLSYIIGADIISASDVIPGFKLFSGFSGTVSLVTCLMVVCITFLAGGIFLC
ncbi:hypothetical protein VLE30_002349 [Salmonella enterica]|nr:hypothetical protein [Salmonella enterica]